MTSEGEGSEGVPTTPTSLPTSRRGPTGARRPADLRGADGADDSRAVKSVGQGSAGRGGKPRREQTPDEFDESDDGQVSFWTFRFFTD